MHRVGGELERLIETARTADGPGPEDRARIGEKLAARLGAGALLATVTVPSIAGAGKALAAVKVGAGTGLGAGAKLAGALVLAAAVGVAAVPETRHLLTRVLDARNATRETTHGRPAGPSIPAASPQEGTPEPAAAPSKAALAAAAGRTFDEAAENRARHPTSASTRVRALARPAEPRESPSLPALAREAKLLQRAQQALRDNQPAAALAMLDEHDRTFAHGALGEEARAARVMALCALDQKAAATREATLFLQETPHSPFRAQVRASCAGR
jgi:hypothetical protein